MNEELEKQFIDCVEDFEPEVEDQRDPFDDLYNQAFSETKERYSRSGGSKHHPSLNFTYLPDNELDRLMLE